MWLSSSAAASNQVNSWVSNIEQNDLEQNHIPATAGFQFQTSYMNQTFDNRCVSIPRKACPFIRHALLQLAEVRQIRWLLVTIAGLDAWMRYCPRSPQNQRGSQCYHEHVHLVIYSSELRLRQQIRWISGCDSHRKWDRKYFWLFEQPAARWKETTINWVQPVCTF
jgi:hypothetical protein